MEDIADTITVIGNKILDLEKELNKVTTRNMMNSAARNLMADAQHNLRNAVENLTQTLEHV